MLQLFMALASPLAICPAAPGWTYAAPAPGTDRLSNVIHGRDGKLTFNNVPVSDEALRQYIGQAMSLEPKPLLVVNTGNIDCSALKHVQDTIARAGGCPEYVCYAYDLPHVPPPPAPPNRSKPWR